MSDSTRRQEPIGGTGAIPWTLHKTLIGTTSRQECGVAGADNTPNARCLQMRELNADAVRPRYAAHGRSARARRANTSYGV